MDALKKVYSTFVRPMHLQSSLRGNLLFLAFYLIPQQREGEREVLSYLGILAAFAIQVTWWGDIIYKP